MKKVSIEQGRTILHTVRDELLKGQQIVSFPRVASIFDSSSSFHHRIMI